MVEALDMMSGQYAQERRGMTISTECGDNRFEIIQHAKNKLIEATNVESSPEEMKVLDNILFRMWQMGWLPDIETETVPVVHTHWIPEYPNKSTGKAYSHTCSRCGRTVYNNRQVSIDEMGYTFCPHCGAKMDAGENDG